MRELFLVDVAVAPFCLSEFLNFPSRSTLVFARRHLRVLPRLRTQTRPSFSRTGSTVLDVCTGLVHGSVAPTFRCGAARRFKGSTARDAVSQVSSSTAGRGTKKGPTIERRKGGGGRRRRCRGRRRGRNSRTSFLDVWRPAGKKPDASHDDEREKEKSARDRKGKRARERVRKEKPLKLALRRPHFSRHLYEPSDFGDQIRRPYYLNFFTHSFSPSAPARTLCVYLLLLNSP